MPSASIARDREVLTRERVALPTAIFVAGRGKSEVGLRWPLWKSGGRGFQFIVKPDGGHGIGNGET